LHARKEHFAEEFKNLARYRSENIFVNRQNNYVEPSSVDDNIAKRFNILAISLSYIILFLHSILMVQTKLISDLYLVKFLNSSAKLLFLCA